MRNLTPVRRWITAPLAAAVVIGSAAWLADRRESAPAAAAVFVGAPRSHKAALAEINRDIAAYTERLITRPDDIYDRESLVMALNARARLTGRYEDFDAVRAAVGGAFAAMPDGLGPWLARAATDLAAHRYAGAAAALDKVDGFVVPDRYTLAEAKAMRSDIALAQGDLRRASALLNEAEVIDVWTGSRYRMALLARATGDYAAATRYFAETERLNRTPTPQFLADLRMRQGELKFGSGDWAGGTALFEEAQRLFSGHWRSEMRVAQMQALRGEANRALTTLARLAQETENPEVMDVLAGMLIAHGDAAGAKRWASEAGRQWAEYRKQMPEAAWGHAVDHEMVFGDPALAVDLAKRNALNRPNGDSLLLLAEAHLANGQPTEALVAAKRAEAMGWRSVGLWRTQAQALDATGQAAAAQAARQRALAINPKAFDANPVLARIHI